jgi:pimeloyl-ACP methyl ester carboxylesterase
MTADARTPARNRDGGSLLVRPDADETGTAKNGSVNIAWRRYGDGAQTVLIVPTWNFVDSRVVRYQVAGLRGRFRVITYDARGSGESEHPATGYSFHDHARDALAVLDTTNTTSAFVVAASAGTHAAVLLALDSPARVRRLALVAPPMEVVTTGAASVQADEADSDEPSWRSEYEAFVPWFISAVFPESDMDATISEIVEIGLQADHAMLLQQATELDWKEAPRLLGDLGCPTLVVHGTDDRTLNQKSVEDVAAAIPEAQLSLLEGLGHRPDISRPDLVNELLLGFFAE